MFWGERDAFDCVCIHGILSAKCKLGTKGDCTLKMHMRLKTSSPICDKRYVKAGVDRDENCCYIQYM